MAKMGRPKIKIDWKELDKLCHIQCTRREVSEWFGCSEDTIDRACLEKHGVAFAAYHEQKKGAGKVSLRRKQFNKAMSGHPTMLIWLGKQYLDQKEKQELSGPDGDAIQVNLTLPLNGSEAEPEK
jgi:hypothetical protein